MPGEGSGAWLGGTAEAGPEHATAELFVGATYLLTPTTHTDPGAYRTLHRLVAGVGARPMAVDPVHHDRLVAVISHLPQLAATTLMNLAADQARQQHAGLLLLAAGGFRDATRVAASNPDLWLDICAENREAIVAVLDDYAADISRLRAIVDDADDAELRRVLTEAQRARRSLPRKTVAGGALVELVAQPLDDALDLARVDDQPLRVDVSPQVDLNVVVVAVQALLGAVGEHRHVRRRELEHILADEDPVARGHAPVLAELGSTVIPLAIVPSGRGLRVSPCRSTPDGPQQTQSPGQSRPAR